MDKKIEIMMEFMCLQNIQQNHSGPETESVMKIALKIAVENADLLDEVTVGDVLDYLTKKYL